MSNQAIILGAGLSGLIAATQFPNAQVFEANGPEQLSHKAVLRFRSEAVSRLTGIPFRKVTVRKSIWHKGEHVPPSMRLANMYSRKTNGGLHDRSIWNLEPVERFIAPEDLQHQMADMIGNRINWWTKVDSSDLRRWSIDSVISTIPMPVMLDLLDARDIAHDGPGFGFASIIVDRYRVRNADVFQTIYFPDEDHPVYRASITGDLLIVERRGEMHTLAFLDMLDAFGLGNMDVEVIDIEHAQRFGKINPIDDKWRRDAIYRLTQEYGIYSLGRFAVWKNILLDDVVSDAAVVKKLITAGRYGASLYHHQKG
jgi:hypothetical protein